MICSRMRVGGSRNTMGGMVAGSPWHNAACNGLHRVRDILVDMLSFLLFASLGLLDQLLCPIFAFLDAVFSSDSPPCYCRRQPPQTCAPSCHLEEAHYLESVPAITIDSKYFAIESQTVWPAARGGVRFPQPGSHNWKQTHSPPRREWSWSECGCNVCNSWQLGDQHLHVHIQGQASCPENNVVFIHGFCSSSSFWVETVLPELSKSIGSNFRLFAVDLLGFGNSPKPRHCSYTIWDHIAMIKSSLLDRYGVQRFHVVGHSMGCVIALALAAHHPGALQSITLMSPPYFPPNGVAAHPAGASTHFMCQVATRKVWPLRMLGTSVMSWYEHVGRLTCTLFCKNHRLWEPLLLFCFPKMLGHTIPSSFITDFTKHTHFSAWHTFHNTLCAGALVVDRCMATLAHARRPIWIIYGGCDNVCPPSCSLDLQRRFPSAQLLHIPGANHITCVLGREQALATDLQQIILHAKQ